MSSTLAPVPGMADDFEAGRALVGQLTHTDCLAGETLSECAPGEWW
jgi:hypothetical protein